MRRVSTVFSMLMFLGIVCLAQGGAMSAQQILEQVISTYASADSYVDEGEVTTLYLDPRGSFTEVKPFSTAFVRPTGFRFEFRHRNDADDEWQSYVIWRDGNAVKKWWSIDPGVKSENTLQMAIGTAAGVSSGTSSAIPSLLMTDLMVKRYGSLSDLRLQGEETVEGHDAYRIEGQDRGGRPLTLWVDKDSLLIVKTFERRKHDGFETETTILYKPQVNVEVAREKLAFNAPEKGR